MKTLLAIIAALAIGCAPEREPEPPPVLDVPPACELSPSPELHCLCGPIWADPESCGCQLQPGEPSTCLCDGVPYPLAACVPGV